MTSIDMEHDINPQGHRFTFYNNVPYSTSILCPKELGDIMTVWNFIYHAFPIVSGFNLAC